jgi:hypothetical protein
VGAREEMIVEQQPPPGSTPPGSTPPGTQADPTPLASVLPAKCPICGEPREDEDRFCESCGHNFQDDVTGTPAARAGISGPVLWLIIAIWAVIGVGALIWLYNGLYRL